MTFLKNPELSNLVLTEIRNILPSKLIVNSLELVLNPIEFDKQYSKYKQDADKYFLHLSEAVINNNKITIDNLTDENAQNNAHIELQLISAKLLLATAEISLIKQDQSFHINNMEISKLLPYIYHSKGNIETVLHGWSK